MRSFSDVFLTLKKGVLAIYFLSLVREVLPNVSDLWPEASQVKTLSFDEVYITET